MTDQPQIQGRGVQQLFLGLVLAVVGRRQGQGIRQTSGRRRPGPRSRSEGRSGRARHRGSGSWPSSRTRVPLAVDDVVDPLIGILLYSSSDRIPSERRDRPAHSRHRSPPSSVLRSVRHFPGSPHTPCSGRPVRPAFTIRECPRSRRGGAPAPVESRSTRAAPTAESSDCATAAAASARWWARSPDLRRGDLRRHPGLDQLDGHPLLHDSRAAAHSRTRRFRSAPPPRRPGSGSPAVTTSPARRMSFLARPLQQRVVPLSVDRDDDAVDRRRELDFPAGLPRGQLVQQALHDLLPAPRSACGWLPGPHLRMAAASSCVRKRIASLLGLLESHLGLFQQPLVLLDLPGDALVLGS